MVFEDAYSTYQEVCGARAGETEIVKANYDLGDTSDEKPLKIFFEDHDPTQGMQQGNDVGTQYRSAMGTTSPEQQATAEPAAMSSRRRSTGPAMGGSRPRSPLPASSTTPRTTTSSTWTRSLRLLPGARHWSHLQLRAEVRLSDSVEGVPGKRVALVRIAGVEALGKPLTSHCG